MRIICEWIDDIGKRHSQVMTKGDMKRMQKEIYAKTKAVRLGYSVFFLEPNEKHYSKNYLLTNEFFDTVRL